MQPHSTKPDNGPGPDASPNGSPIPPNPFDPARFRLGTDYAAMLGTQEHLLEVPVRKPGKETWFRVHPSNRLETGMIEVGDDDGGDRETFLVDRPLWPELASEPTFGPRLLVHYVTRLGVNCWWPIKLPKPGDKLNPWTRSALGATKIAETEWVRLRSDRALGAYIPETAKIPGGIPDDPRWADYPFEKLLELAFRDRLITSLDHPILMKLRGEI